MLLVMEVRCYANSNSRQKRTNMLKDYSMAKNYETLLYGKKSIVKYWIQYFFHEVPILYHEKSIRSNIPIFFFHKGFDIMTSLASFVTDV